MDIDERSLFREIALIDNEHLVIENHVLAGKITDIDHRTGEIIYVVESQSVFHSSGLEYHGTLFFNAADQSCFVSGRVYFQPPDRIIMLPLAPIAADKRKEARIEIPNLPCEISSKHGLFHQILKGFISDLCSCGAAVLTEIPLKRDLLYYMKTSFPFHTQSLEFTSSFAVKRCSARKNMFSSGISFLKMDTESKKNLTKYFGRKKT